jgi:uncharacterized protein YecT (DUF1311 family)
MSTQKLVLAIVWLLLISVSYAASETEARIENYKLELGDQNHVERAAALEGFLKADRLLNSAYSNLHAMYQQSETVHSDITSSATEKLKRAQIAWLSYRDASVEADTAIRDSELQRYMCLEQLTTQRYAVLKTALECLRDWGGGMAEQAKKALQELAVMEKEPLDLDQLQLPSILP